MRRRRLVTGVLAAALVMSCLPGNLAAVPEEVQAAETAVTIPTPIYEFEFENNLTDQTDTVTGDLKAAGNGVYSGNAQYVDGINGGQAINLGGQYGVKLNIPSEKRTSDAYTVSFWTCRQGNPWLNSAVMLTGRPEINKDGKEAWNAIAGAANDSTDLNFWANDMTDDAVNWTTDAPNFACPANEWQQYTVVVNDGKANVYKNGEVVTENVLASRNAFTDPSSDVLLGITYWSGDGAYNGYMDDVKIYNEALTAEQAAVLYEGNAALNIDDDSYMYPNDERTITVSGATLGSDTIAWESSDSNVLAVSGGTITAKSAGTATITAKVMRDGTEVAHASKEFTVVDKALIADFNFDDDTNGFSGAGATAKKMSGTEGLVTQDGVVGNALQLDGNDDWLSVTKNGGSPLLTGLGEFTVSYDSVAYKKERSWAFFAAPNDEPPTFEHERYVAVFDTTDRIQADRYMNMGMRANVSTVAGKSTEWKHVDVVFRKGSTDIYVDGKKQVDGNSVISSYAINDILGKDSVLQIGKGNWVDKTLAPNGEYFQGMLDNYKIYNYALTDAEIQNLPESVVAVDDYTKGTEADGTEGTFPKQTGKVFAGWFADNSFETPFTDTTGKAFPKYVDEGVASVKVQVGADAANSDTTNLRLITTVDDLNYQKVGFRITINGTTLNQTSNKVWETIYAQVGDDTTKYMPKDFCESSKYFYTLIINNIPKSAFESQITVQPYVITMDGTMSYGVAKAFTINDVINNAVKLTAK